jgi:3-hydroxyisobutyrate dehydrogenase-like beta-hydroxyacid dehydrogenase
MCFFDEAAMADRGTDIRVGLIGLGNAGMAMLQALAKHSAVHIYDRNPDRLSEATMIGGHTPVVAGSAADLARNVDLIILSLPMPAASLSVAEEIRSAVGDGKTIIEASTVRPEDVEALHDCLSSTGARVVDAAVVGGVHKLSEGKGVFLVGVPEAEAGIVATVLCRMAEELFFLAGRGDGMRMKLIVNGVAHAIYVVLMEAGALAGAQKLPLSVLYRLLERESGLMRPLTHRFGERLREHDFAGGMSTINARKDSALILETARALGVPMFATQAAHAAYEVAVREGLGTLDYASIGTLWEKWLGISFKDAAAR